MNLFLFFVIDIYFIGLQLIQVWCNFIFKTILFNDQFILQFSKPFNLCQFIMNQISALGVWFLMLQFYVIPNRLGNKNENYVAGIFLQGSKKVTKALSF